MRTNFKIILIVILLVVVLSAAYATFTMQKTNYKNISINGYAIEVPDSNNSVEMINENYKVYNDNVNNITMKSYAINNVNETNYTGVNDVNDQIKNNNASNVTIANKTVMNKSDTYTYYEQGQYQMIVITTKDKNTMEHILETINKTTIKPAGAEDINLTNQDNNTSNTTQQTTTTKKSTTKKSTQREEDKVTASGWNPKEHEVSREKLEDGYQKVHYDDNYFRIVDRKGNIVTYGYA